MNDFTQTNIKKDLTKQGIKGFVIQSVNSTLNHLIKVHAIITHKEPVATTTSSYYYVIYKDTDGILRTISDEFTTVEIHKKIDEQKKVKCMNISKV